MHKNVAELVRQAKKKGWVVELQGSGHLSFKSPRGERVTISSTPSDSRSMKNALAELRKIGWDRTPEQPEKLLKSREQLKLLNAIHAEIDRRLCGVYFTTANVLDSEAVQAAMKETGYDRPAALLQVFNVLQRSHYTNVLYKFVESSAPYRPKRETGNGSSSIRIYPNPDDATRPAGLIAVPFRFGKAEVEEYVRKLANDSTARVMAEKVEALAVVDALTPEPKEEAVQPMADGAVESLIEANELLVQVVAQLSDALASTTKALRAIHSMK